MDRIFQFWVSLMAKCLSDDSLAMLDPVKCNFETLRKVPYLINYPRGIPWVRFCRIRDFFPKCNESGVRSS